MFASLLIALLTGCSQTQPDELRSTPDGPSCPPEMALVYSPTSERPPFCIDRFEARVQGEMGSADQFIAPDRPATGTATSKAGVEPTALSYSQANVLCARTPMGTGPKAGFKQLATFAQWTDAADGTIGPGGLPYPYGDQADAQKCALTTGVKDDIDGVQPTGSYPDCVSPFGVFDQLGNLWEWVDSGKRASITSWFEQVEAQTGIAVTVDDDDTLHFPTTHWTGREPFVLGVTNLEPGKIGADGRVVVPTASLPNPALGADPTGYLAYGPMFTPPGTSADPGWVLPIHFADTGQDGLASLRLRREADGVSVGFKVGGSWYSGSGARLDNQRPMDILVHAHEFRGSIAARCVGEVLGR